MFLFSDAILAIIKQVKQDAVETVFRPAMDIVEDVILDNVADDDFVIPKKPLLKRVENRFRAKKRPQEPKDFDFEVCVIIFSIKTYQKTDITQT